MWRAWGVALLFLSQDLDQPVVLRDHECSLRPPLGWVRKAPQMPAHLAFAPKEKPKSPCELEVKTLRSGNPANLNRFVNEAREWIANNRKGAEISEKRLTISGRPASMLSFTHGEKFEIKTIVHRNNLEFFLVDAWMGREDEARFRGAVEASIASFQILPAEPTAEQAAALDRTVELLKGERVRPEFLGERWFGTYVGKARKGYQRFKLSEAPGKYLFEIDAKTEFEEGVSDTTLARGEFSPDGAFQKIETERTKVNQKNRWQFRASALLKDGRVTVTRDMNGEKEEASFAVAPGVLFTDVADFLRGRFVLAGKGTYLFRLLSPYSDEPGLESLEVNEKETMELDGRTVEAHTVFGTNEGRRNQTYFFLPDGSLIRLGAIKDIFAVRRSTKEEVLKP